MQSEECTIYQHSFKIPSKTKKPTDKSNVYQPFFQVNVRKLVPQRYHSFIKLDHSLNHSSAYPIISCLIKTQNGFGFRTAAVFGQTTYMQTI